MIDIDKNTPARKARALISIEYENSAVSSTRMKMMFKFELIH